MRILCCGLRSTNWFKFEAHSYPSARQMHCQLLTMLFACIRFGDSILIRAEVLASRQSLSSSSTQITLFFRTIWEDFVSWNEGIFRRCLPKLYDPKHLESHSKNVCCTLCLKESYYCFAATHRSLLVHSLTTTEKNGNILLQHKNEWERILLFIFDKFYTLSIKRKSDKEVYHFFRSK